MLYDRVYDPDEGVRLAVIKLIDNIISTKDQDLIDLLTADLLRKVGTRIRDKKVRLFSGNLMGSQIIPTLTNKLGTGSQRRY